jgi:hypothetical protein
MGVVGGEGKEIAGFTFLYKILNFFLKQFGSVPLIRITGWRSKHVSRALGLIHEMTTSVEGEALWLSVSTPM